MTNRTNIILGLAVALLVAGGLIFPRLGRFGMWEPSETNMADAANAFAENNALPEKASPGLHLEERLVALAWSTAGRSELTSRLPLALLGLISVAALFVLLAPIAGPRTSFFAALVTASAPVFLFHARQLTFGMPLVLGEVLALCGLACFAWGQGKKLALAGAASAVLGLVLSWLEAGLLVGVAFPTGTAALALALNGDAASLFKSGDGDSSKRGPRAFLVNAVLAVLAAGAFFVVYLFSDQDIALITGGGATSAVAAKSFEFSLKQLAFGWYPWSALAPVSIIYYFVERNSGPDKDRPLRSLAVAGLITGFFAWTFFVAVRGSAPVFLTVPMALSVALAIRDMERSDEPLRLGALVALACLAMMIRDFAQQPEVILSGFGFEKIKLPTEFKPIIHAAIAAAPVAILILILGFFGSGGSKPAKWRSFRSVALTPASALVFGGYISFILVPGLSVHLSSKYAEDAYKRFKKGDEELAVYGGGRLSPDAEQLESKDEVVEWLNKAKRNFVMFPHKDLADVNNRMRKKTGEHILVLDAKSDRFVVATSKLLSKEKNANPIAAFVRSRPFSPGPENPLEVNFENKVTLLGWTVRSEDGKPTMVKGKDVTFETFWRCDKPINGKYKIFMHIDGPGGRIHGDHDPLDDVYPTNSWVSGDYIKDVYRRNIALYQKDGKYTVRLGLFKGRNRLKVFDYDKAKGDSVLIGSLDLE